MVSVGFIKSYDIDSRVSILKTKQGEWFILLWIAKTSLYEGDKIKWWHHYYNYDVTIVIICINNSLFNF